MTASQLSPGQALLHCGHLGLTQLLPHRLLSLPQQHLHPPPRQPGRLAGDGEDGAGEELVDQQTDQAARVDGVEVLQADQDLVQVGRRPHALNPGSHGLQEEAAGRTLAVDDIDELSDLRVANVGHDLPDLGGEEPGQQLGVGVVVDEVVGEDRDGAPPDDLPVERGCRL